MEQNKKVQELLEEYRGLRVEDLDETHPFWSCVICGRLDCPSHNTPGKMCAKHLKITEGEWISFYRFQNPNFS